MPELKTSESLLLALRNAAKTQISAEELREQRISFILGALDKESGVTREKIVKVLDDQQGKKKA